MNSKPAARRNGPALPAGILPRFPVRRFPVNQCILAVLIAAGSCLCLAQSSSAPDPAKTPQAASAPSAPLNAQGNKPAAQAQSSGIARECSDLLQMATELKDEVDKSNQDILSVTVVRKADAIEQLAHRVRTRKGKK